jgi:hypothetical protein
MHAVDPHPIIIRFLLTCGLVLLTANAQAKQPKGVPLVQAYVDSAGAVHVVDANGKDVKPKPEKHQADAIGPVISPDHLTVGWLVEYPTCCTSYPVQLTLVIYRHGRVIRRLSNGMMIYTWRFVNGGKQLAFSSGPTHGEHLPHFELQDVQSGRLLEKFEGHLTAESPHWTDNLSED